MALNVDNPASIAAELGPDFARTFDVLGVLGKGGMGIVLRCRQKDLGREVAVKLMLEHEPDQRQRFHREGKLLAMLRHPNLITVLATGEARGRPYLVFELVIGQTLRETLDRFGQMEIERGAQIVRQVAEALALAHEKGILHRDVKATNILLTPDGTAKLGDFGLALAMESRERLTRSGIFMGTPEYTAPEVIRGDTPQPSSDLYSLGMVLYETLSGHTSFGSLPLQELMKAHLDKEAPLLRTLRPDVPLWLEYVVKRLLAKDSKKRYQSAGHLAQVLADGLEGRGEAVEAVANQPTRALKISRDLTELAPGSADRPGDAQRTMQLGRGRPATSVRGRRTRVAMAIGAAALLLLGAGLALSHRPAPPVRVFDLKSEAGQTQARVLWKTSVPVRSWLEVARADDTSRFTSVPRPGQDPARDHSQLLSGLAADTAYRIRALCEDRSVSLDHPLRTAAFERPRFRVDSARFAALEVRTREPLDATLAIGERRLTASPPGRATTFSFPLDTADILFGIERPLLVYSGLPGQQVQSPLPAVLPIARDILSRIDMPSFGRLFTELYGRNVRSKPDRERIFARVKQLSVLPYYNQFKPLAEAYFKGPPEVPEDQRVEFYNRLLDLEVLDASALDFKLPLPVGFAQTTKCFVERFFNTPPFKPQFHWSTDFQLKRDGFWLPRGDDPELFRIRRNVISFTTDVQDRHTFRVSIAPAELAKLKRAAIVLKVSNLVLRSYFELTVNGRLKMVYRPTESWDYDPLSTETSIGNAFSSRFLKPGPNTLEIEMKDSPGVSPITSAQIWAIDVLGE
ncbi:MAG: serine/threonine protein kinase [Candidatus Wallbacteria bacterium]|nr:serine/threonine protein kinase [Candidatus Wallbacteria bacterium]